MKLFIKFYIKILLISSSQFVMHAFESDLKNLLLPQLSHLKNTLEKLLLASLAPLQYKQSVIFN